MSRLQTVPLRFGRDFSSAVFTLLLLAGVSAAQYVPGTLSSNPTTTTTTGVCTIRTTTYNWSFKDTLGNSHAFPASTNFHLFEGCSPTCGGHTKSGCFTGCGCPPTGSTSQDEWSSDGRYYLEASAGTGNVTSVAGYLNPKYLIMGVTYAPPGGNANSNVNYSDTNFVGNTTNNSSSFSNNFTYSISICGATGDASCGDQGNPGGGMFGFGAGVAVTGSESQSWTQESNSSKTITVTKESTIGLQTPGIPNVYSPYNHDYDSVRVWLNPVTKFTFVPTSSTAGNLYWNGYGYDWNDPLHEIDVWPVLVGYLNGDFKKPDGTPCYATDATCDPQDADALSRGWVTTQSFGPGKSAAITQADLATICTADPFCANPNYTVSLLSGVSPPTTTDQRFTLAEFNNNTPQTLDYKQAGPGSTQGDTYTQKDQYSNTTINSQGGKNTYQHDFGLEEKFVFEFFWQELQTDIKQSWTMKEENDWQNTVTNTSTQTDTATITGPPCPAPALPCIPAFTEPHEFAVYQDNLYGTFMFWPNPFFSISVTPATKSVNAGGVVTYQVPTAAEAGYTGSLTSFNVSGLPTGATAAFSPSSGTPGFTSTLTVSTATSSPTGTYPLTISATDSSLNYFACIPGGCPMTGQPYATLVVNPQPGFSVSVAPSSETIGINASTTYTVTVGAINGFNGVVSLNVVGLPSNTSASFNPETVTGSGTSTLTINTTGNTPPGTFPLTFTGTSGSLTASGSATLVVTGASFTLSATPEIQSITRGGKAVYTVTSTPVSGFNGTVTLTLSALPAGATYTFNPATITGAGSSTLTVSTQSTTPTGDYQLTITGTSGNVIETAPIDLQVN